MFNLKLAFVLSFFSLVVLAQDYVPIDTADTKLRKELKTKFDRIFAVYNSKLKSEFQGKKKTELINNLESFQEDFYREIDEGQFVFDERFQRVLDTILVELQSKNLKIPKDIRILLSKYPTVNAYTMPEGTIVVNMGCFKYLENEDQLASIIAHEIGHNALEHIIKSQIRRIDTDLNGRFQQKIKNIKQRKFGRNESAFQMMRNLLYEEGNFKREQEKQADSIGFMFFTKTRYEDGEFINAFKLLQRYDTLKPMGVAVDAYRKYFDLPNQSFREDWLKMEDFSRYDYSKFIEKINKDSISTHPEALTRIEFLEKNFPHLKNIDKSAEPTESFLQLKEIAEWEEVPNLYFLKEYGIAVYIALLRLEQGKSQSFYKYWLGECFDKIYQARKQYKLNRYLETVNPKEQSESYMQFLNFMWNLSLDELKNIADYYKESANQ